MMDRNKFEERYRKLKKMRFSALAEELKAQYEDPHSDQLSSKERIFRLIDAESQMRDSKKFQRILKELD